MRNIDLVEGGALLFEQRLGLGAIGAVVFGVDGDHKVTSYRLLVTSINNMMPAIINDN